MTATEAALLEPSPPVPPVLAAAAGPRRPRNGPARVIADLDKPNAPHFCAGAAMRPDSVLTVNQLLLMLALAEQAPEGPFVEVGVYKGGSAWHLAAIARLQGRTLHLFDTFAGIPYHDEIDNHPTGDFGDASLGDVRAAIPDARFHVGVFPDTLPPDLTGVAFVHADCDQYRSVEAVIEHLVPRLAGGGVIVFDDYGCTRGATRAVDEALAGQIHMMNSGRCYYRRGD